MLITTQPGRLYIYQDGALVPTAALDLSLNGRICSTGERGLMGVAIDPNFASNRFIYLFYTFNKFGVCPLLEPTSPDNPVNRVSRFTLSPTNSVDPASETILIDNIPSPRGNHAGGDLHFGKDGFLYISTGDGGCDYAGDSGCAAQNNAARDRHALLGKILRIKRDGGIPASNPFLGTNSARCNLMGVIASGKTCQETFAWGLRHPFRFAFDPNASGTRFFINDVGQQVWEEIDLGTAGADYGWNVREGPCPTGVSGNCSAGSTSYTKPIYAYNHSTDCEAVTGGAFLPNGHWPAEYTGSYFYGDYECGKIFRLVRQASGAYSSTVFATELGANSAVHLAFGPHDGSQALYYTTFAGGGQVRRISFTGSDNRLPRAVISANPLSGPVPLEVTFDASQSSDPDGDALSFEWSFGDGSPPVFEQTVTHAYAAEGTFHATLTATDAQGGQDQATVRIDAGHEGPNVTILSPSTDLRFRVGQSLTLSASALDEGGQPLPDSALSWTALLHHNTHTHPYFGPAEGNNIVITAPAPEELAATKTSFLELQLVATDARGQQTSVVQNVLPKRVQLSFATVPSGRKLDINGTRVTAPRTYTSWQAYKITVRAPDQTDASGRRWVFKSWSDGGGREHVITTPGTARTYTATFQ
jgi:glucose/arabinose dehydrogenase